ncbi:MAG: histidine kinase, partial [Phycisphaeraceae bacterium]
DLTERHRLMNQIVHVAAEEQQRIGHDLHDGLGQELTGISLLTGVLRRRLAEADRPEATGAREIVDLVNDAIAHLRGLVKGLCPVKLQGDGLMLALEELATYVENRFDVTCHAHFAEPIDLYDRSVATHVYYLAREAVHNAVRHGRPDRVSIELSMLDAETARLQVTDDGIGLPQHHERSNGRGMQIMAHRTRMMNGIFRAQRAGEDGGTLIQCTFPLPREESLS